jgi:nucleoside-diphosphate-sugar epimerase
VTSWTNARSQFSAAVTGANGFIGTYLVKALAKQGVPVLALSRSKPAFLSEDSHWIKWSAEGEWPMDQLERTQIIFHLAASTSALDPRISPETTMDTNALSILRLVDQLRQVDYRPKIISIGSVTELESAPDGSISDASPIRPRTFYDVSKVTQRMLLDQCVLEGWVAAVTMLLPNVYGYWTSGQARNRGFLNNAIQEAINGRTLTYFDDAAYVRDFLHVDDVVDAMLTVSRAPHLSRSSYVIGTGIGIPIREALHTIANVVKQKMKREVKVSPLSPPLGLNAIERRNAIVSYSPFTQDVGWLPKVPFRDGVAKIVDQHLEILRP